MASSSSPLSTNFLFFLPTSRASPSLRAQLPRIRCCSASPNSYEGLSLSSESLAVANPALSHSNTLFFSGYNVQVVVDENEPEERLLGRFRREVMRAGVIQECKRRRFFENKQDEKKRRTREAAKRNKRRRSGGRFSATTKPESSTSKKKDDDDEDNWDLPEDGAIPY